MAHDSHRAHTRNRPRLRQCARGQAHRQRIAHLLHARLFDRAEQAQVLHDVVLLLLDALAQGGDVGAVLRRLEWKRAPDRWAMIAATDFLARSFTWQLPGAGAARGLGLAALQAMGPVKSALARQMMYGAR